MKQLKVSLAQIAFLLVAVLVPFADMNVALACLKGGSADSGALEQLQLEMDLIAGNIANINTTRTPEGGAYKAKYYRCSLASCEVIVDDSVLYKYEPDHPDADIHGYVAYPNINLMSEISAMIAADRRYNELLNSSPSYK